MAGALFSSKTSGYLTWIMYALALLGGLLMLASYLINRRKRAHTRAS
jgi:purine-cytosine permease-like protein